jgi:phosphoglycerate kinase
MSLEGISTIEELELGPLDEGRWLNNKRVFVRVDFNVPLDDDGQITDDSRIRAALPTIQYVVEAGAKVILGSHLGRPKGKRVEALSLEPAGARLAELTGYEVVLPEESIGDAPKKLIHDLRVASKTGSSHGTPQVCLLENLRFYPGEKADDDEFARALGELCEVYLNDAFGTVHRAHASVHALPRMKRDRGVGMLVRRELESLSRLVDSPASPYLAVIGGAKVSDKLDVIESLFKRCDAVCIGGAMANTFLAAQGHDMKNSLVEEDKLALARTLIDKAQQQGAELHLPSDVVVAESIDARDGMVVPVSGVPDGSLALDIGPATVEHFSRVIAKAKTVFWNGPMGLFESEPFASGTFAIARAMSAAAGFTVVGGGDSAAAVRQAGDHIASGFDHISTGGGASLRFIEGRQLPGIEALRQPTF